MSESSQDWPSLTLRAIGGSSLLPLLDRRVLVCCGTGGVGKTTIASAIALMAARRGKRVLVMTIDPARRLADALGVGHLPNEATSIPVTELAGAAPISGELHALMLDVKSTWDDAVNRFSPNEETAQRILEHRFYRKITEGISGSQEYSAMLRLLDVLEEDAYDLVVVDTPPARNALEFLDAPRRVADVLEEGVLKWLVTPSFSATRAGLRIFGKGSAALFSIFERFTGAEVLTSLSEFATSFSGIFGGLRSRAQRVQEHLARPSTAFVLVTQPTSMSVREAASFLEQLIQMELPFGGFVINRVRWGTPDTPSPTPPIGPVGFPADPPAGMDPAEYEKMVQRVWDLHRSYTEWAEHDRGVVASLKEWFGEQHAYLEVPELGQDLHDLDALGMLETYLL